MSKLEPSTRRRCGSQLLAVLCATLLSASASAAPIVYDGFDYAPGGLVGGNGGTGDWKSAWSGDAGFSVLPGTYGFTDSGGRSIEVTGNHVELDADYGSALKATRQTNGKLGTVVETVWMSVLLQGSGTSAVNNVSLGDGVFIGQGGKDTGSATWQISDQDGLVSDTGISASGLAMLVLRVDFTGGDENAWLWVDTDLGFEPTLGTADASGVVKSFEADFVQLQLESFTTAGIDEIRVGFTFEDVPEPALALLLIPVAAALTARRRLRTASADPHHGLSRSFRDQDGADDRT